MKKNQRKVERESFLVGLVVPGAHIRRLSVDIQIDRICIANALLLHMCLTSDDFAQAELQHDLIVLFLEVSEDEILVPFLELTLLLLFFSGSFDLFFLRFSLCYAWLASRARVQAQAWNASFFGFLLTRLV